MSSPGCSSLTCTPPPQLKLYQAFIFATPILFTLVLLLLFCVLYMRRRRRMRATSQIRAQLFTRGLFSAPLERGLNKSFRDGLPVLIYNEAFAASRDDTQCAVCLGDYQKNERLQQLPICGHAFHKDCIDKWLINNSTCPICRTSLLQSGKVVPMNSPAQMATQICSRLLPMSQASRSGSAPELPQGENSSGQVELSVTGGDRESGSNNVKAISKGETSHRPHSSMEEVVKESFDGEHAIQIER